MNSRGSGKRYRLAVVNSHPIQYFAPLYRRIAESQDIEIMVYYCSRQGMATGFVDPGFGKEVIWDVPLLGGYPHKFLRNLGGDRGVRGFFSLINPSIISEIRNGRYDALVIHGHNSVVNLLAVLAARLSGTRVFMRAETHLLLRRHPLKRALRALTLRPLYALCDAFLYIGTRNRDFYLSQGVPVRKLFFVPYSVDNEAFAARADAARAGTEMRRHALGVPPEIPIILYAAKLMRRKRPRDLLAAHAELIRRGVRAALLFVGEGEERAPLEREAGRSEQPYVAFAGFVNQGDLPAYYAMADVFVLPSEDEPWGLAVNEAMACGVPVVATSEVGAAADLIRDGETGYTYPTGNVAALADALAGVISDSGRGRAMREKCRQRMASWSYAECEQGVTEALRAAPPRAHMA